MEIRSYRRTPNRHDRLPAAWLDAQITQIRAMTSDAVQRQSAAHIGGIARTAHVDGQSGK